MTILDVQDELSKEVGRILKDVVTTDASGKKVSGVTVYKQQLPLIKSSEDDADSFFPYAVVEVFYGATEGADEPWEVDTEIQVAVHDEDEANQGHEHIAVMCQRIIDRFCAEPLLAEKYYALPKVEWAIPEEDTHPYFFGLIRLAFQVPKIGRRMTDYD